ncbi:MAG TPA: tRNA uridine-5-carboxymethylaminomethyl(34) synthesis GTPase MnmE [Chitinophagales bacterium]|nr:tRNA uridine-5-carboxymethylaminomethyl(34) synthesis GTPase MnmE [Chitinophagales bacterium]HMW12115.1 tRNA uridine-5-carboxymethylaminomethyl(34) synthesis GTPase MnmE [Chitinophagales bacterium]HMX59903.1 tRNA uridine-5-carboxymethylaminomethyl(34) synthesis GTPase MnmE [Chitinophagales bacterium]HMY22730.1 tRNA uridine-5-carboxymethylaminomethyl(34) synthesis GTPase MnmE [Chitinophagales bacterium]HMZ33527.1 tRNA uridine-5-carboxymethylaminomethyl(34) synthesis GTPase MnmE [Chitinophagal
MTYHTDTIVALSTPPGLGAVGVIRISGTRAIEIVNAVFKGKNLLQQASHTLHFGKIVHEQQIIDEVIVGIFLAPTSYTKENIAEISCHGSPYILQKVIEVLIKNGARSAKPGEFTMRAFLNGRFDLSQAEAVADLIAADSEIAHKTAMQQMRGGFSLEIKRLREELIHFASLIELELDFGEEDVEFADRMALSATIEQLLRTIYALSASFKVGNVIKKGVPVVLAGRPNAGKSTLLNALVNEERAIVSNIAGTTRDIIEVPINIDGLTFRLIDTAGIREASDTIEAIGVKKTFEQIENAAILLYIFDANDLSELEVLEDINKLNNSKLTIVLVANKCDLCQEHTLGTLENSINKLTKNAFPIFEISAHKQQNIHQLKAYLTSALGINSYLNDNTLVTNIRHFEALNNCYLSLEKVSLALQNKITTDFLAQDIRHALSALSEITGSITTEDLLDNIFSKFCIGK